MSVKRLRRVGRDTLASARLFPTQYLSPIGSLYTDPRGTLGLFKKTVFSSRVRSGLSHEIGQLASLSF
jgi:hypothetical protein